jgi:ABC-2 type transport system permease protein
VRWLLLKDLRLLRRSPLLVALLILYPIVIAVLIGFALSRGPDKPQVAFANLVPKSASGLDLGGESLDTSSQADVLFRAIDPVIVKTRAQAIRKVKDGDVLGAIVIPEDTTQKLQSGIEPATIEVLYNAEDPVKARYVRDTIKSQVQDANTALTKRLSERALELLDLIASGGEYEFLGRDLSILGLRRSEGGGPPRPAAGLTRARWSRRGDSLRQPGPDEPRPLG